jgi:hypothetical protein
MTSTTRRSRVPDSPAIDKAHYDFLDGLDKRQQRLGELEDLDGTAATADIIAKINAMLQTHRTR